MDSVKNFGRYEIKKEKRKDSNQTKQQKQTKSFTVIFHIFITL